jgi:hypothetical protein
MRTTSFDKEALNITIHNLYPGLELIPPIYCSNGTTSHLFLSQQTDVGTIMKVGFGIFHDDLYFKCALLYKLQRKHTTKTDEQPNSNNTCIEDTETNVYLLTA